jgi:hypothetical protein
MPANLLIMNAVFAGNPAPAGNISIFKLTMIVHPYGLCGETFVTGNP